MSSALKPALPTGGAQASPSKVVPPSPSKVVPPSPAPQQPGARPPPLVGQNLVHHQSTPAHPAQNAALVPMSPVSQNMAQMAQNMSHHGNLSHLGQNNAAPIGASNGAPQSSKAAAGAPLSLVQDKCPTGASQPLALTRPDKKDEEVTAAVANGVIEPANIPAAPIEAPTAQDADKSKAEASVPAKSPAKPSEAIAAHPVETSPAKVDRTPTKPTEKLPATPKPDMSSSSSENQLQVNKLGSSTDVADKTSPAKPKECKEPPQASATAQVAAASSTEPKVPDESASAKISNTPEPTQAPAVDTKPREPENKASTPSTSEKTEAVEPNKPTESKTDSKEVVPQSADTKPAPTIAETKCPVKENVKEPKSPKKEDAQTQNAVVPKKDQKTPIAKSTLKLATVTPPVRKRRQESKSPAKSVDEATSVKKPTEDEATPDSRASKRNRTKVQPYQSPTPELAMATKLSASAGRSTPTKPGDDKLIVFYKNEYLAVRNAEGGFYVCQTVQNVYRSSRKIKIRWLSQDKTLDPSGDTYKPDFYDVTDMECVLTTLSMARSSAGGGAQVLSATEAARAKSILDRALTAETSGQDKIQLTEEHPDGLDLSLYTDESQLEKKKVSRKRKSDGDKSTDGQSAPEDDKTPSKREKRAPRKSPKTSKVEKSPSKAPSNNNKRKSGEGSSLGGNKVGIVQRIYRNTALVPAKASPAKTTAKKAKPTPKKTPAKAKIEAKPAKATPPPAKGKTPRKSDKDSKMAQLAATPSTSTGKTTRTPRKPPSNKRISANNFILR